MFRSCWLRSWLFLSFMGGLLLAACSCGGSSQVNAEANTPPPPVQVAAVESKNVSLTSEWIATMDGYINAKIQPHVSGYLVRQNYREGSFVRKGDVLFEIDPRPFQAILDQAQGQLAQNEAQVIQAQAQLAKSSQDVKRDTPLAEARAIAQSQLDNDLQAKNGAEAAVVAARAAVTAAKAAVEQAQLNLSFTKIVSLVDGVAGIAQAQIGDLVTTTTVLTSVSQVNPIKVYFPMSEQDYLRVQKIEGREARNATDPAERSSPDARSGRRRHLSLQRPSVMDGPPGRWQHWHNSRGGGISQPRQYPTARRIRQSASRDRGSP